MKSKWSKIWSKSSRGDVAFYLMNVPIFFEIVHGLIWHILNS
jgi:hypothetical protein